MITERTRLIDVTVGDFINYLKDCGLIGQQPAPAEYDGPALIHGLDELAQLLGCSKSTVLRHKQSGEFDEAISQVGRKITIDARKVLEIARRNKLKNRRKML